MSKTSNFRWPPVLVSLLLVGMGWSLWGIFAARPAEAQTLTGVQGDRTRITLRFQVKPEAVQAWLPSPWQLNPLNSGPLSSTLALFAVEQGGLSWCNHTRRSGTGLTTTMTGAGYDAARRGWSRRA